MTSSVEKLLHLYKLFFNICNSKLNLQESRLKLQLSIFSGTAIFGPHISFCLVIVQVSISNQHGSTSRQQKSLRQIEEPVYPLQTSAKAISSVLLHQRADWIQTSALKCLQDDLTAAVLAPCMCFYHDSVLQHQTVISLQALDF
ncbi:hypothetical protein WMY93_004192 [Mugilogobius chulae]|uniref:Uncharacterized protein n=1 Tax=Mugilogobius chulae TaxID=88201 RepID=A0AAW0PYJ7_9GOBI